ncbi:MAG: SpoIIE family protein phosphatase [Leptospira sp.]|nr:SpoIIE family protein phosphatase [Leptospira sp.]
MDINAPKPEILVIDDDESICETLEVIIQSLGYYCVYFTDPDQGLEYFQRESSPLVLLDVNLPNMSGLDILAKFKEINPMTQVLMMTGEREIQTVVTSLYNRATDFLLKPFTLDSVKAAIARALEYFNILKEKEANEETILRDLRLASKVQSKIFQITQSLPHKISAKVDPAMYVSGDYYQVIPVSDENTLLLMGDIEDHGVTSGLIGLLMNSLVKEIAKPGEIDPSVYLKKMNPELVHEIGTHSMTCVVLVVNNKTKSISYSRGGHPFPILYPSKRSEYKLLSERSGHLLGIMDDIEFNTNSISYEPGDLIVIYSDGLVNSLQSPVLESLNQIHLNSNNRFDEMIDCLTDYTNSLRENSVFQDDISYLLCEL